MLETMEKHENYQYEPHCTFEHEGKEYTSGGAFLSPDYAIGYLKFDREYLYATGEVTTWHGEHLGTARISAMWKVKSYIGSHMMQVECCIEGVWYTGRSFGSGTFGSGMIWKGKRCKNQ